MCRQIELPKQTSRAVEVGTSLSTLASFLCVAHSLLILLNLIYVDKTFFPVLTGC